MTVAEFVLTRLYCGRCCRWIVLETTVWRDGRPYCPFCNNILRITHRYSRQKNKQLMNKLKRQILEYYEMHHRIPDYSKILIKKGV